MADEMKARRENSFNFPYTHTHLASTHQIGRKICSKNYSNELYKIILDVSVDRYALIWTSLSCKAKIHIQNKFLTLIIYFFWYPKWAKCKWKWCKTFTRHFLISLNGHEKKRKIWNLNVEILLNFKTIFCKKKKERKTKALWECKFCTILKWKEKENLVNTMENVKWRPAKKKLERRDGGWGEKKIEIECFFLLFSLPMTKDWLIIEFLCRMQTKKFYWLIRFHFFFKKLFNDI